MRLPQLRCGFLLRMVNANCLVASNGDINPLRNNPDVTMRLEFGLSTGHGITAV